MRSISDRHGLRLYRLDSTMIGGVALPKGDTGMSGNKEERLDWQESRSVGYAASRPRIEITSFLSRKAGLIWITMCSLSVRGAIPGKQRGRIDEC